MVMLSKRKRSALAGGCAVVLALVAGSVLAGEPGKVDAAVALVKEIDKAWRAGDEARLRTMARPDVVDTMMRERADVAKMLGEVKVRLFTNIRAKENAYDMFQPIWHRTGAS